MGATEHGDHRHHLFQSLCAVGDVGMAKGVGLLRALRALRACFACVLCSNACRAWRVVESEIWRSLLCGCETVPESNNAWSVHLPLLFQRRRLVGWGTSAMFRQAWRPVFLPLEGTFQNPSPEISTAPGHPTFLSFKTHGYLPITIRHLVGDIHFTARQHLLPRALSRVLSFRQSVEEISRREGHINRAATAF